MSDLLSKSISQLRSLLDDKQITASELTKLTLESAKKLNPITNSYISITSDLALSQAKKADKLISEKKSKPLTGIPFSLKDAYITQDILTTSASSVLGDYQPQYNSTVYQKLLDQHAILIGKNNQDAWGHGGLSENTDYKSVKNPYNIKHSAGGSSGGTAAALASFTTTFAIGEDTGGSIRNPSSFCNVSGLKVTYGRVSRYGAIAYASSLDSVGPMARSVEDLAIILKTIAGFDPLDASSSQESVSDYTKTLNQKINQKTIGIIKQNMHDSLDPDVKSTMDQVISKYQKLGANIVELDLPTLKYGVAIYYILALSETSSNLARYDGVRFGSTRDKFTPETKRRIMTGTFALSSGYYDAYYKKALQARTKLIQEFTSAFNQVDCLLSPVIPHPAPKLRQYQDKPEDPLSEYLADQFTCPINTVGVPSLAIPGGFSEAGLPIGFQLIGPMFSESTLLNIGHQFQQATSWHTKKPKLKSK
ncbi:amidase [Pseudomonadota bacterium]